MFSTHKYIVSSDVKKAALFLPLAGFALLASTGCQRTQPAPVVALNNEPILVDEAMQQRDWERSTAVYQNGDTVAGFTGRRYEVHNGLSEGYAGRLADPAVGIGNVILLPITMVLTPPWKAVGYQGVIIPPTHHANPPVEVVE